MTDNNDKYFLAAWQCLDKCGSRRLAAILAAFPSAEYAWCHAKDGELLELPILSDSVGRVIVQERNKRLSLPEELADSCQSKKIHIAAIDDEFYPELLRVIPDPPHVLFYRGKLHPTSWRIAMVGSRRVTPYGRSVAEKLSGSLAAKGIRIVSGAAVGVDTMSHKGALKSGITDAVLGCGVDIAYPPENQRLLDEIAEQGAVVSEYMPGSPPTKLNFPARNRIISGMARGTVVVEAAVRSGSLITAEQSLSYDRDLFAIPGSIFSYTSLGCNHLIQQGAKLVLDYKDILNEYPGWQMELAQLNNHNIKDKSDGINQGIKIENLPAEQQKILNLLSLDLPLTMDEIIYKLHGRSTMNVSFILLQLELKGLVRSDAINGYTRTLASMKGETAL